jgi:hypothetical protein
MYKIISCQFISIISTCQICSIVWLSKSFIKNCKAYKLDQDSKVIKIEDLTLDLEVVKLKQHILEVTIVKKETQKLPKHKFDFTIVKEKTQLK